MDIRKAFEQGNFLEVADAAAEARSPEEDLMVGISLFKMGRETEAMDVLRGISDRMGELARAYYYMALILKNRGDVEAARSCIGTYLAFHPDDDEAQDLVEGGEEQAPLMDEDSPELARLYAGQGHYRQALDIYSRLSKNPGCGHEIRKEAARVQNMYLIKTLEGWLERVRR